MLYALPLLDKKYNDVSCVVKSMIQDFPAHNSFHPIKHNRFEDITSLIKQEKKIVKAADVSFDKTDIVALTESWKLMTALFQLLFAVTSGKVFPSELNWCKSVGITDVTFNMERCFINAIVGCVDVYWFANSQELTAEQIETYRKVISNAQSHIVVLHHVRCHVLDKIALIAYNNAKKMEDSKRKKEIDDSDVCSNDDEVAHVNKKLKSVTSVSRNVDNSLSLGNSSFFSIGGNKKVKNKKKTTKLLLKSKRSIKFSSSIKKGPPVSSKKFMGTLKFHLLQHLPDQATSFGCIKENVDTSIFESTNKDMSDTFERSTKRFESAGREMLKISERTFHIETSIHLAKDYLGAAMDHDDSSGIVQILPQYFVAFTNKGKRILSRCSTTMKWDFKEKGKYCLHPQFSTVKQLCTSNTYNIVICMYSNIFTY
jgi:chorismate mutase